MRHTLFLFTAIALLLNFTASADPVGEVMDGVVQRISTTCSPAQLDALTEKDILEHLSTADKEVLATQYWRFQVNTPVRVSVMRDKGQATLPFWLPESGFLKTDLIVKNKDGWAYEVWQKDFEAGEIGLGINGFDKHRPHYFVSVKPLYAQEKLRLSKCYPQGQQKAKMKPGVYTYVDWSELVLTEVPESLLGGTLLQTWRGRAREAHVLGAFRQTDFPASETPDQIVMTWEGDPTSTQSIQWRMSESSREGVIRYRRANRDSDWQTMRVRPQRIHDRLLINNPGIHHFTARLTGLDADCLYEYQVGNETANALSDIRTFKTAKADDDRFSFLWTGDVHCNAIWGGMMRDAVARHPESRFYCLAGDLVNTGLYRDDWDALLHYGQRVFNHCPFMPCLGNHDDQDGLGAGLYLSQLDLPKNAPACTKAERAYWFRYGNALFFSLDIGASAMGQAKWMRGILEKEEATWKFAMFHFPPYAPGDDYPLIRMGLCPLFDEYHFDMVFNGHIHIYLRSHPLYNEAVVDSPDKGTIYVTSIGIPGRDRVKEKPDYAAVLVTEEAVYQYMRIEGPRLQYQVYNAAGELRDELEISK